MDRVVRKTIVEGVFGLPIGIKFLSREVGDHPRTVTVSTVCLDGGHLEDPLGICDAETGFETMVFLEGCTFFSLFTAKYRTRREAVLGHKAALKKLIAGTLPLAIPIGKYFAHEATDDSREVAALKVDGLDEGVPSGQYRGHLG